MFKAFGERRKKKQEEKLKHKKEGITMRGEPMPELLQIFTPDRIEEHADYIRIDDIYCRILVVEVLPELICFGWFNNITSISGVTVSVTLHPYTQSEASDRVGRWQTILGADLRLAHKHEEMTRIGALETKYAFYYQLLTDINLQRNNIVAASVTIMVTASTYEEIVYKCHKVKDMLSTTKALTMYYRQMEGFTHTLPFIKGLEEYHDVTIANATCLSPMISTDFSHPSGIYFGRNSSTGAPVFLDLFIGSPRLFGPHMFITGTTRSGKSFTTKGIVARSMAHGIPAVIVDPEGEYRKLVKQLGGILVVFKPNMECMFNLFDVEPEEDGETGRYYLDLAGKAEDICQMVCSLVETQSRETLSAHERARMAIAIRDEYTNLGINENPESLFLPEGQVTAKGIMIDKSYKDMPTISGVVRRLREMEEGRLADILIPFCKGGGMGYFDGQSQVSFYDNQLVVFDVKELKTEYQRMYAMYVMLSWIWEKYVKKSKRRKRVVVDEAWLMMNHPDTAKFLSDLARRGAKYNTSLLVASQSFREFLTDEGKVLLGQCSTKLFLKMQHTEAQDLGKLFNLPYNVVESIERFYTGQGILQAGSESAIVQFEGFPFEEYFLRSDPEANLVNSFQPEDESVVN